MSRTVHLVNWLALLYAAFFLIYWIRIYENEIVSFDEFVLEKQANYAADAAVEELLFSGDTDQDYNAGEYLIVDPDLAVREFTSILAEDFDFVPTTYTERMIQEKYIKTLLICTWDGVYAYWYQPSDDTGAYSFCGTPKIPYFYTSTWGSPDSSDSDYNKWYGTQYCLNLSFKKAYKDSKVGSSYTLKKFLPLADGEISKDEQLTAINNEVSDIIQYTLVEAYKGSNKGTFEIPALASEVEGAQPVDRVTVIGVVEGQSKSLSSVITAECIGGAQITANDPVIGVQMYYPTSGTWAKIYAYSSYWKNHTGYIFKSRSGGTTSSITSAKVEAFDNVFQAAAAGYYDLYTSK